MRDRDRGGVVFVCMDVMLAVIQKQDNVGQSFSEVLKLSHSQVVFVII